MHIAEQCRGDWAPIAKPSRQDFIKVTRGFVSAGAGRNAWLDAGHLGRVGAIDSDSNLEVSFALQDLGDSGCSRWVSSGLFEHLLICRRVMAQGSEPQWMCRCVDNNVGAMFVQSVLLALLLFMFAYREIGNVIFYCSVSVFVFVCSAGILCVALACCVSKMN